MLTFSPPLARTTPSPSPATSASPQPRYLSRRRALSLALSVAAAGVLLPRDARATLTYGKPSTSELLHKMDRERPEEEVAAEKAARAAARRERLERQKEMLAEAERRKAEGPTGGEGEAAEIEANLRANYYYPTARKRYLPRVKRAFEDLGMAKNCVREGRWPDVEGYVVGSLADLVLPMRLYASSLAGQGLSLAAKFVQEMAADSDKVEASFKKLQKAVKKRDQPAALACLSDIENAISAYRRAGRLEAADFGIGEVPKDARVGSGLGNNNPALYNRNFIEVSGGKP